jgi:hypothetical protein
VPALFLAAVPVGGTAADGCRHDRRRVAALRDRRLFALEAVTATVGGVLLKRELAA